MALVTLNNVEEATESLIRLHDLKIDRNNLRVSFSKPTSFQPR